MKPRVRRLLALEPGIGAAGVSVAGGVAAFELDPLHRTLTHSERVRPGKKRPKIRVAPDGNRVALTCSRGVEIRSLPENEVVVSIEGSDFLARALDWSRDGGVHGSHHELDADARRGSALDPR